MSLEIEISAGYFVILLIVCTEVDNINCQKYVMSTEPANWYQALINCRNGGMELASVHSEEEHNELDTFVHRNGHAKGYWLAGTKEGNGQFYWATTGLKMVYTKWVNGQPDDAHFDANFYEGEHCVAWSVPDYVNDAMGWSDLTCSYPLPYICQTFEYCYQPNNI